MGVWYDTMGGWGGGGKKGLFSKTCDTYTTMMKLATVIT